jgi:hypothetical protein
MPVDLIKELLNSFKDFTYILKCSAISWWKQAAFLCNDNDDDVCIVLDQHA